MKVCWLDSDVLIWSKDNAFRFNAPHAKDFWSVLERGIDDGLVRITRRNFWEMTNGRNKKDELAIWLQTRQERCPKHVGVSPSKEVQELAGNIGAYVFAHPRFLPHWRIEFSKGADAWLIAQAAVDRALVVTRETNLTPDAQKPKIPNLCKHYNVGFINMFDMLDQLTAAFTVKLKK
jgi:hypothetical protein